MISNNETRSSERSESKIAHKDARHGHTSRMKTPSPLDAKISTASPSQSKVSHSIRTNPASNKHGFKLHKSLNPTQKSVSSSKSSSKSHSTSPSSKNKDGPNLIGTSSSSSKSSYKSHNNSPSSKNGLSPNSIGAGSSSSKSSSKSHESPRSSNGSLKMHSIRKFSPTSESSSKDGKSKQLTCACVKSKCLKLYCVCFERGVLCNAGCKCRDCANNSKELNGKLMRAKQACLKRKPDAFTKKPLKRVGGPICGCRTSR